MYSTYFRQFEMSQALLEVDWERVCANWGESPDG